MKLRVLAAALAAAPLAAAPVAAQAAPVERVSAPTAEENELAGGLLWIVAAIAVVIGAILLLDDDPDSP